jgi:hypothetical protein
MSQDDGRYRSCENAPGELSPPCLTGTLLTGAATQGTFYCWSGASHSIDSLTIYTLENQLSVFLRGPTIKGARCSGLCVGRGVGHGVGRDLPL